MCEMGINRGFVDIMCTYLYILLITFKREKTKPISLPVKIKLKLF